MITYQDFENVDIRVGKVVEVHDFPEGKTSSHILYIDFGGELGWKKSLANLKPNYKGSELIGRLVCCVVNFEPKQVGQHLSEVLTLGFKDKDGNTVLIKPDKNVPIGGKLH